MVLPSLWYFTTVFSLKIKFKSYNEDSTHLIIQIILLSVLTSIIPATDKLLSVYHMLNIYV